ncbi:MAG: restriction endonuclease subunit S [Planctomycetota bacterium]
MSSNGWNTWNIGDIGRIVTGKTPPTQNPNNFGDKYPFITPRDMLGQKRIHQTERYLSEEGKNTVKNCLLPAKSVCVSCIGSDMGKVVMTTTDSVTNQQLNSVICKAFFDPDFVYYALVNISDELRNAGHHSTAVPILNKTDFSNFEITASDIVTQRRIGNILSALDEKIELNRQTNATLEAIAHAIFKEWFMDFNFPDSTGEMVESELGMIPKGWEVKPLPEAIEVNPSRPLRKDEIAPYLDMANMPTQGHRGIEWVDRPFGSGTKFINGDTLLARITPCLENGKTAFVDFLADGQTGWGSTEYIVLHPKAPLPPEYGYYLARFNDLRNHAIQNMIGTSGRQRTPASSLDTFLMVVPEEAAAKQYGLIAAAVISQIRAYDEESRTLAAMRDTLLPKLMNGDIEV